MSGTSQVIPVFQLSAVNQDDGRTAGRNLKVRIVSWTSEVSLRHGSDPVENWIDLGAPPTPAKNWFFEVGAAGISIDQFSVTLEFEGDCDGTYHMGHTLEGANLATWVATNYREKTNQIYREESCGGIFGYAQCGPAGYIYTFTGGVSNPKLHPPSGGAEPCEPGRNQVCPNCPDEE